MPEMLSQRKRQRGRHRMRKSMSCHLVWGNLSEREPSKQDKGVYMAGMSVKRPA